MESSSFCQSFKLQIKSSSTARECFKNEGAPNKDHIIPHLKEQDYLPVDIKMGAENRLIFEGLMIIKNVSEKVDLEIILDHSSIFFIQTINLIPSGQQHAMDEY